MEKEIILNKAIKGGGVVGLFVGGQYFIAIITQIVLARILEPSNYGILAFVLMVTLFFNNFDTNIFIIFHSERLILYIILFISFKFCYRI